MFYQNLSRIDSLTRLQKFYLAEVLTPYSDIIQSIYCDLDSIAGLMSFLYEFGIHVNILNTNDPCSNLYTFLTHQECSGHVATMLDTNKQHIEELLEEYTDGIPLLDADSIAHFRSQVSELWKDQFMHLIPIIL